MLHRLVVVVDFSPTAQATNALALLVAKTLRSAGADLRMEAFAGVDVAAVKDAKARRFRGQTAYYAPELPDALAQLDREYRGLAEEFAVSCRREGLECEIVLDERDPFLALAEAAERADLVILARDADFMRAWGLTADVHPSEAVFLPLLRAVAVPLIIGPKTADFARPRIHKVLLAYDNSDAASRALHSFAGSQLAGESIVHVVAVADQEEVAVGLARRGASALGAHCAKAIPLPILRSDPTAAIMDQISDIDPDLLVMGAFGTRTWKKRIFGSATSRLLQDCPCPIFIQR